jgi:hypothetical protein
MIVDTIFDFYKPTLIIKIMKKITFITLLVLFSISYVNAQDIKYGVKGGLNLSSVSTNTQGDTKSKLGVHLGGVAEISLNDKFSLQPELLFSTQGAKIEFEGDDFIYFDGDKETWKLNYINIPVMAKYYVKDNFSLEAGPQIGFLLSAKLDYDYVESDNWEAESGKEDIKDQLKGTDFALNFGTGYDLNENMSIGIRYSVGLSNIAKNSFSELKNNILQASFSYFF